MNKSLATTFAAAFAASALLSGASAIAAKPTNRQAIDHFFEVVDGKRFDKLAEVDAADLVMTTPMGTVNGPAGHAQMMKGFAMAFPNFKHTANHCIEVGEEISCEGRFVGDHTGPMMTPDGKSIPATHKHVEFPYVGFAKVKDGKVAQLHVYFDLMGFMQQLGTPPSPSTASK
jgi:predicted ester cyclase